jgi:hypothetical protein
LCAACGGLLEHPEDVQLSAWDTASDEPHEPDLPILPEPWLDRFLPSNLLIRWIVVVGAPVAVVGIVGLATWLLLMG